MGSLLTARTLSRVDEASDGIAPSGASLISAIVIES
jgi:hypothetical protein